MFTVHPVNFTTYEDITPDPTGWYPEAPFNCTFSTPYYGVRPVITWEVKPVGGAIESVPLPNLRSQLDAINAEGGINSVIRFRLGADTVTYRRVLFQFESSGFFQLHFPNRTTDDRMQFRCVATQPDDATQVVRSNWATLFVKGKINY